MKMTGRETYRLVWCLSKIPIPHYTDSFRMLSLVGSISTVLKKRLGIGLLKAKTSIL